jgi:hypothetical protein
MVSVASLVAILFLLSMSALFSGLTLGLMGLDMVGLRIVIESGERPEVSGLAGRDVRGVTGRETRDASKRRAAQRVAHRANIADRAGRSAAPLLAPCPAS